MSPSSQGSMRLTYYVTPPPKHQHHRHPIRRHRFSSDVHATMTDTNGATSDYCLHRCDCYCCSASTGYLGSAHAVTTDTMSVGCETIGCETTVMADSTIGCDWTNCYCCCCWRRHHCWKNGRQMAPTFDVSFVAGGWLVVQRCRHLRYLAFDHNEAFASIAAYGTES